MGEALLESSIQLVGRLLRAPSMNGEKSQYVRDRRGLRQRTEDR